MKKLLSNLLCFVMLFSLCVPVMATEITKETAGQTIISYGMSEGFLVIIPGDFTIDSTGKATANISAENVMLGANKSLEVSISGDDYINSWELIDREQSTNTLTYIIGSIEGSSNIRNNSVVLSVEAGEAYNSTVTETMYFTVVDELTKSGTYQDTLTFTVSISGGISTEATTASGKYISVSDVAPITHDLGVTLSSDTIDDFSDITVKRMGKNVLNLENAIIRGGQINTTGDLVVDERNGALSFIKTVDEGAESGAIVKIYLPAGTYTFSAEIDNPYSIVIRKNITEGNLFIFTHSTTNKVFTIDSSDTYEILFFHVYYAEKDSAFTMRNAQIEMGTSVTEFERYTEQVVVANADGSVNGLTSVSPNMTIMTDSDVNINLEYLKKKDNQPSQIDISPLSLPAKSYGVVGKPITIYFLNLTEYNSLENLRFVVESDGKGTVLEDRWEYTPQTVENINLTITAYDNEDNVVNRGSMLIEIREPSENDMSVLVIGDSTIGANQETQQLLDLANNDNYNLSLLGTLGSGDNRHEGRGGWTAGLYVNTESTDSYTNVFYNPGTQKFDFDYYMTQQGYSDVDVVVIQLGINDIFSATTDEKLSDKINTYFTNMEYIIEDIHSYDENIKIVWNLLLPGSTDQSKFEEAYGDSQTADRHKTNTYLTNLEIIQNYSNINNVFVAPINISLDSANNMAAGGGGGVHPATAGYVEIGTMLYSFIRSIN